jgi:hypothetical protein
VCSVLPVLPLWLLHAPARARCSSCCAEACCAPAARGKHRAWQVLGSLGKQGMQTWEQGAYSNIRMFIPLARA